MTDKQIIIDGVDVKDCKRRIGKENYCRYYKRPCAENNYNCIWKKYLRKEQECEELKKVNCELTEEVSIDRALFAEIDKLKAEVKSKTEYIQEQRDIINQYSKEIEMYKKCQGKRASKREEELKAENKELKKCYKNNSALLDFEETNTTKLVNKVMKLSKTLTEIKEIAEKLKNFYEELGKCEDLTVVRLKQILQKISEVEDG